MQRKQLRILRRLVLEPHVEPRGADLLRVRQVKTGEKAWDLWFYGRERGHVEWRLGECERVQRGEIGLELGDVRRGEHARIVDDLICVHPFSDDE